MLRLKTMHLREERKERKRELKNYDEKLHSEIKYLAKSSNEDKRDECIPDKIEFLDGITEESKLDMKNKNKINRKLEKREEKKILFNLRGNPSNRDRQNKKRFY